MHVVEGLAKAIDETICRPGEKLESDRIMVDLAIELLARVRPWWDYPKSALCDGSVI